MSSIYITPSARASKLTRPAYQDAGRVPRTDVTVEPRAVTLQHAVTKQRNRAPSPQATPCDIAVRRSIARRLFVFCLRYLGDQARTAGPRFRGSSAMILHLHLHVPGS